MRNWKNWVFPLLTCLIVVGLALLPLRLSLLEDGKRTGVVHSEALGEDSNFPAKPPELPGRIWLLTQRNSFPDGLTIMDRELSGADLDEASALVRKELRRLEEAGGLPEGMAAEHIGVSGNRIYLRDQTDLSSASFLELNVHGAASSYFWLCLDLESGRTLALSAFIPNPENRLTDMEALVRAFWDGLELEAVLLDAVDYSGKAGGQSIFRLTDCPVRYVVQQSLNDLLITPDIDWETLYAQAEREITSPYILDSLGLGSYDGSGTDHEGHISHSVHDS